MKVISLTSTTCPRRQAPVRWRLS